MRSSAILAMTAGLLLSSCADHANTEPVFEESQHALAANSAVQTGFVGVEYRHGEERSSFSVGAGTRAEGDNRVRKVVGDRGTVAYNLVNGAVVASMHAPRSLAEMPRPLSNPDEHSQRVREYFIRAGMPASEIAGSHVTTLLAGGGTPQDLQEGRYVSRLVRYTTHLERAIDGIPVEGSLAFASLSESGEVLREAVFWPAVPEHVVAEAQALRDQLKDALTRSAFIERVRKGWPDGLVEEGEVKIVHTAALSDMPPAVGAVYEVRSRPTEGKRSSRWYRANGELLPQASYAHSAGQENARSDTRRTR